MKQNMMRVAVAATLGLSAFAASAGTISVNAGATLAAEYITNAAAINQPSVTFQTSNLLTAGSTVYVHVRFSAGVATAPNPATDIKFSDAAVLAPVSVTLDTDKKGYYFPVVVPGTGLASGATISILKNAQTLTGLSIALSNGGTVSTSIGYTTTAGDFSGVSTWIEAPTTATVLTAAKALSTTVLSSAVLGSNFDKQAVPALLGANETATVDITTAGLILKQFTAADNKNVVASTKTVNLGYLRLNAAASLVQTDAATVADAADFGDLSATLTGDFSAPAAANAVFLSTKADCSVVTADLTAGIAADQKSVQVALTATQAKAGAFVCYTVDNKAIIAAPTQYTLGAIAVAATVAPATLTVASTQTGGDLYKLVTNGASVFVPSFVPTTGALGSGYNTYLRIVNTGNRTADISAFGYNQGTGVAGSSAVIAPALAPNASVVLTTDAITNALGLAAGWSSLQVTGATSKLAVQPLMVNPQGVITNIGGANN